MERLTEFPFVEDTGASRLRMMFCFHHAGGSAAVFRPWTKYQERLMVVPVELPGKATRISEKPATDGEQLVSCRFEALPEAIARRVQVYVMDVERRVRAVRND